MNASRTVDTPAFLRAQEYRLLGPAPIPVYRRSKVANLPEEHPFLYRRATEEEFESFDWSGNIGLVTGKLSGIVVLDIDGPEGMESLRRLGIALPDPTATVKTGKGWHVYFKYPDGMEIPARVRFAPGLDLKSDGGYVLAPHSTHPNGSRYEWKEDPDGSGPLSLQAFGVEGLAEMPEALIEAVRRPRSACVSPSDGPIVEGGRNDTLTAIAGSLQARGVDDDSLRAALQSVNKSTCEPPLEPGEVDGIARGIRRYEKGELRHVPLLAVGGEGENDILASRVSLDMTTKPEPPEMLHLGILMKGKRHILFGKPGCGKSWMSAYLTVEAMKRGETVLYLDNENYADEMRTRLVALGADPLAVSTLLVYLQAPPLGYSNETGEEYVRVLEEIAPDLVVFDSWVNFLTEEDRDENDSKAVSRWSKLYLHPATERGITSVLLDHTPHEGDRERGSSRKRGEVEIAWRVTSSGFDQVRTGDLTLTLKKSRSGALPKRHTFTVGGAPFVFEPHADGPKLSGQRKEAYEYIRDNAGCIRNDIPLKRQRASEHVATLIETGLVVEDGERRLSVKV